MSLKKQIKSYWKKSGDRIGFVILGVISNVLLALNIAKIKQQHESLHWPSTTGTVICAVPNSHRNHSQIKTVEIQGVKRGDYQIPEKIREIAAFF